LSHRVLAVNFNGLYLPRITLGCDPFECYTAFYPNPVEKEKRYSRQFSDVDAMLEIVSAAIKEGITAFHFSRHKNVITLVEKMTEAQLPMKLIPLIFRIPLTIGGNPLPLRRTEATVFQGITELIQRDELYRDFMQTPRFQTAINAKPLTQRDIDSLNVDHKRLARSLQWYQERNSVNLVTTCVDLFPLIHRLDLLGEACDTFAKYGFDICAGAHSAEAFEILNDERVRFNSYFAPFNKMGFFMLPSPERMLNSILKMREPFIAIKPLAGGRLKPREAFNYIFNMRKNAICIVGLSSIHEVAEAVQAYHHIPIP
jgi:hypothetical protein